MIRTMQARQTARRGFLIGSAAALVLPAVTGTARAAAQARGLSLVHTHTGERIEIDYAVDGGYVPEALQAMNRFLRDHYSGEVGNIDPLLLDQLHALRQRVGGAGPFEVISGYRCPATNDRLRRTRSGGVATRSLHMDGRAIDVRLRGVPMEALRGAALEMRGGGVGYYARDRFVHLDTGRVRRW